MLERTLSILKPDVIKRNIVGNIISYIEQAGLKIVAQKMCLLTQHQAKKFYEIHKEQPFFSDLISFMTSGPVIVQVLVGEKAVTLYREVIGATDPKKARPGSIRADFAESIDANCVHGSDNLGNAEREIQFFFPECEILY
ncbi:nucleoside-diphosphate kinase [Neoehrlichia mikurensis]|uniref:Nucleoside diphosphate kinase n=1 Tax=Neoehrlichia mikurensis TaxID=89586 RepID=A0A9Q9BZH8_9RICK|nr:nucleoside-diphosphate kinase [Neoehrlichia mikurensis]QXK91600.1 nucleoside-diphosphate kinase [Neoehrlichia mikurensis]QXK92811.1 nucleoside-diphosphate kinase [Neoehrlichia mikurensis]QXK93290.1 nucleoside-diphosphate kinase [Neoehrlichia mikurensis]UTO55768.1 nucleoside-diphosphate kinase [Neoehrlichia mikurensis]UTO56685.1 nucleoside-diphosphate kinase [Neoehrlichia mikurensis]